MTIFKHCLNDPIKTHLLRYFFHIGYKGSAYSGWQRHPDGINIQFTIEKLLSQILKTPIEIIGCGRTDAGVHASQFFFHADLDLSDDYDLLFRLNKGLPDDIAIFDIIPMEGHPHARFDAVQRSYDYFIHTSKDPFLSDRSALYDGKKLNLEEMKKAVELLPKYNDYKAFCTSPAQYKHTICHVSSANLYINPTGDKIRFYISSNRFLGRMIRIIVGKLLEIGKGKLTTTQFEYYLANKETPPTIIQAHPQGLYLSKITYPYLNLPARTDFSIVFNEQFDDLNKIK